MSSHIVVADDAFLPLVRLDAGMDKIAGGMLWTEGPVYFPHGDYYIWSDIPNNAVYQWMQGVGYRPAAFAANNCNGHTRDHSGRLISCEHLTRRVTRLEPDGSITVLADTYDGRRLNSPNDVVVKSDGTIWFTDPPYGILTDYEGKAAPQEQAGCFVFRYDPIADSLQIVADDFVKPNGLAFSPDESQLYISDTGQSHDPDAPHHIRVLDVEDGKRLHNSRVFVDITEGMSDGFRADVHGNIWTSCAIGVQCYAPDGRLLGTLKVPEKVSNLAFGGQGNDRLMITASTSVYMTQVAVKGTT